jgi:hypothetical protein
MRNQQRCNLRWLAITLSLLLAACGGGGGGGGSAGNSPASNPPVPAAAPTTSDAVPATPGNNAAFARCPDTPAAGAGAASATAALTGRVTYDRIPFLPVPPGPWQIGPGLDYANPVVTPARGVIVEAVDATGGACAGPVLDTVVTDGDGWYALNVERTRTVCIRARAQLYRAGGGPGWNLSVVDNTEGNSLYALADSRFASASQQPRRDLHAGSGWSGSFSGVRAAAPFAILDTACQAVNAIVAVQPDAQFGAMTFRWSTRNTDTLSGNPTLGKIGGAYYNASEKAVYLRGDASSNTDEFDPMVIAHEFGHFVTDRLARGDGIGGDHSLIDRLDPRLAFDEGWATAFAGLVLNSRVYRDSDEVATAGSPSREYYFYLDNMQYLESGWFTEATAHNLIYAFGETDVSDGVGLGFGPIWQVFTQRLATAPSLHTMFSFAAALKSAHPAEAGGVAALLNARNIVGDTIEPFAATETHAPDTVRDLPVYASLAVGGAGVRVCSRYKYAISAPTDSPNKLSMARLLKLDVPASGNYRVTVTPESTDSLKGGLAGLKLFDRGRGFACASGNSNIESLAAGSNVSLTCAMQARTYVAEVYQTDFTNDDCVKAGNCDQCFTVRAETQ